MRQERNGRKTLRRRRLPALERGERTAWKAWGGEGEVPNSRKQDESEKIRKKTGESLDLSLSTKKGGNKTV